MVFVHRRACAISLSFTVHGFTVYLLPRRRKRKEEMLLQSWVVCSIEVKGSVTSPKNCIAKGMPEKDTGSQVKLKFFLHCVVIKFLFKIFSTRLTKRVVGAAGTQTAVPCTFSAKYC